MPTVPEPAARNPEPEIEEDPKQDLEQAPEETPETPAPAKAGPREAGEPRRRGRRRFHSLPWKTRAVLATVGVLLVILGVAGLFLPFLQGILLLALAAAVLSLASERVYGWLRSLAAERWPRLWERVERLRTRVLWRFRR